MSEKGYYDFMTNGKFYLNAIITFPYVLSNLILILLGYRFDGDIYVHLINLTFFYFFIGWAHKKYFEKDEIEFKRDYGPKP